MSKRDDKMYVLLNEFKADLENKFEVEQNKLKEEHKKSLKKQNKKLFLYIIIFSLLFSSITAYASYTIGASSVSYTPTDNNWQVSNTQEAIDDLFDSVGSALVGAIYSYMGNNAPHGYLACDGSVYRISDYPRLAGHIQGQFGSYNFFGGDGTTTFAVPDLRGEFLRGTGTNSHTNQGNGASVGVHQDGTGHEHMWSGSGAIVYPYNFQATNQDSTYNNGKLGTSNWNNTNYSTTYRLYTSRPTNTSVLYIIKY